MRRNGRHRNSKNGRPATIRCSEGADYALGAPGCEKFRFHSSHQVGSSTWRNEHHRVGDWHTCAPDSVALPGWRHLRYTKPVGRTHKRPISLLHHSWHGNSGKRPVSHDSLIVCTNLSACAWRFGERGGSLTDFTPTSARISRNSVVNSRSQSWIRYRLPWPFCTAAMGLSRSSACSTASAYPTLRRVLCRTFHYQKDAARSRAQAERMKNNPNGGPLESNPEALPLTLSKPVIICIDNDGLALWYWRMIAHRWSETPRAHHCIRRAR